MIIIMSSQELLQQIAENTKHSQQQLLSITSRNSEFKVEFPSPIRVSEIALTNLSVYHSWPNITSEPFSGKRPNNTFVVSWETKDGKPIWETIYLRKGAYQIEQINDEIQHVIRLRTNKIPEDEIPVSVDVHEPTLSSTIVIKSPDYRVDIYNSSVRTILG